MTINPTDWPKTAGATVNIDGINDGVGVGAADSDRIDKRFALTEVMLDAVVVVDHDGLIVEANPSAEDLLGWRREDLRGRKLDFLWDVASVSGPPTKEIYRRVKEQGSWRGECGLSHRDGSRRAVELIAYALPGDAPENAVQVVTIRDISKRKEIEAALIESQHRLNEANRIGRIGHWEVDAETLQIRMFGQLFREFGADADESVASHDAMSENLHADDRALVRATFERAIADGGRFDVRYRMFKPDGSLGHVRAVGEAYCGDDGVIAGLRGTIQDVDDLVVAEKALRENRDLYSRAAYYGKTAPWEIDIPNGLVIADKNLSALLGVEGQPETQPMATWIENLAIEDVGLLYDAFADFTLGQEKGISVEYRCPDKDGNIRWLHAQGRVTEFVEGRAARIVGTTRDISEHKRAEEALREGEGRLRALMEGTGDGVFFHKAIRDDQGTIVDFEFVDINPRGLALLNCARDDLVGSRLSQTYPESFNSGFFERAKLALESGVPLEEEVPVTEAMEAQWLGGQIVPYEDGIAYTARDITERKRAEEELRETQARLQEAHRLARLNDWRLDLATQNITIYGPFGPALKIGKDPAEISLDRAVNAIHPKDADRAREAFQKSIAEGTNFESTHRVRLSEQRMVFLHLIGEAERDDDGTITGMRGTMQDVTAERESERALKRAKEKLSVAQRIAGIGSFDFVIAERVLTGSEEFFRIFDLTIDETSAMTTREYNDFVHPEDRERVGAEIRNAQQLCESYSSEYRIVSAKGVQKFVLGFAMPLFGDEGEFIGFTGTLQDVTALKQAEQKLLQAQKMEAVGQLTGGIAHDFNNLLAIITGNLDLARMHAQSDPQLMKMLEAGLSASERGAELTRQLLAYSRRQMLVPQPTDANELTSHMLRLGRRALGEAIDVTFESAQDAWWVQIDPAQLESALLNLAINARDAMPEGGTLTIRTQNLTFGEPPAGAPNSLPAGDYVEFEVADTGTGMSEDVRQKVFEPFFTTKEIGQGSGLGLSMVYGFAKQSGGQVNIRSTVGEGTSVYIYLPRAKTGAGEANAPRSEIVESGSREDTILIVEDDPHVRDLAITLVESLGYSVMHARDPKTALQIVESDAQVDLLLSDVILGKDMNGVELANHVRENHPGIEILLMSGNAREAFEKFGGEGDRHALINKPFRRADLAAKIASLLQKSRL